MKPSRTIDSWVRSTTRASAGQALVGGFGLLVLAAPVLFVTFWLIYLVVYLGFDWVLPHTHDTRLWLSFGGLALLFVANALTDRRRLESFALYAGPHRKKVVTIYIPFVGMGSTINPFSREYAGSAVKVIRSLLLTGPRLVVAAMRSFRRYVRLLRLDTDGCTAILERLAARDGPIPFEDLGPAIPDGHDAGTVFSDVQEFDGVRLVTSDPAGLSLTPELRQSLRKRRGRKKAGGKREAAAEGATKSLVLLLREVRDIDENSLRDVVNATFGLELNPGNPHATEFVTGEQPFLFAQFHGRLFQVLSFARPYFEDAASLTGQLNELRARKALVEHRAWISVDLRAEWHDARPPDAYCYIGKLLAALAPADTLALLWPQTGDVGLIKPWDRNIKQKLQEGDPLAALTIIPQEVPVIAVSEDDPRMQAAVAEARRRWPEFAEAFRRRQPGQQFAVKAPVHDRAGHVEYMWLGVLRLEKDTIHGELDSEPVEVESVRLGSRLAVSRGEVIDWLFGDGDSVVGGFTVKVLEELTSETRPKGGLDESASGL
jgi:uncharacterized protein YegJ (DUF2314 family)